MSPKRQTFGFKLQGVLTSGRKDLGVGPDERLKGIQKIFDLHMKKDYKRETLFVAANIFDRYLFMIGAANFPKS